jgi:hypothetical protein
VGQGEEHECLKGEHRAKIVFAFCSPFAIVCLSVFNRCPMPQTQLAVPTRIEHERLEFALMEIHVRSQYLTRLRGLSRAERAEWDRREALRWRGLVDHELEHGCSVESFT